MNRADLESRLTRAFNEHASTIGEDTVTPLVTATESLNDAIRRPAPGIRHSRWAAPLLAAAAVLAVLAGTVVAIRSLSGDGAQPAVRPIPPAPSVSMAPTTVTTGPPSGSTSPTVSTHPASTAAAGQTLSLGGAQLKGVPLGWRASPLPDEPQQWCFVGQGQSVPKDPSQCLMTFTQVSASMGVSVDQTGGIDGNSAWCGQSQSTVTLQAYGDRTFGGRAADYRRWLWACADGANWSIEQYVADNNPGYILFSDRSDAAVHAAMTAIAATSTLPATQAPLRLGDYGILRSVSPSADGYQVSLDRVIQDYPGLINSNPATYAYDIPTSVLAPSNVTPTVGHLVNIFTNGTTVIGYRDDGLPVTTSADAVDSAIGVFADCRTSTVQPSAITLACADGGIGVSDLHWTAWTSQGATGVGTLYYNDDVPNSASGHFHYVPNVTVRLSTPRTAASGAVVWTQASLSVVPPGTPATANPFSMPTQPD